MRPNSRNDLSSFWMPFSTNRDFLENPRMISSANGVYYYDEHGRDIIDATAGLWCVNAGHRQPKIIEAISNQAYELDYSSCFNFGHPKAFELSNRLCEIMPEGLNHVFYTNSGSESVDTALKIALHYHRMRGDGSRTRLIGRERGYHGVGFGGISVGGMVNNRKHFGTLLTGVDHIRHTHDIERNAFSKGCPEFGTEFADDLERVIALHDASTIAAVIVEPVAGATGVLIPPKGYLKRLREICSQHGILLIFDEVITGFGRLGKTTAAEYFDVIPDIITTAKGITNGTIPMGAVIVSENIYQSAMENADAGVELFHGYTYSASPIACATALATLDIYKEQSVFENCADLAPYWQEKIHAMKSMPHVIDIRNLGLVGGIELAPRDGVAGIRGADAFKKAWAEGVMIRAAGDVIAMSPPLVITKEEIDIIFERLSAVLQDLN